ncbi:ion transporter [Spirosoma taeanense]|uniref:Ion transporter n=1 Tax=Spirosoma taeanense TaxID=2735870 RepID=A0A6M5Y7N5_9BACT|nr:ion transporter [Spirosoma taeanense]QJW89504.1 ion transporter [Spirosoma taeanense]
MATKDSPDHRALKQERYALLRRLNRWLETPMVLLGFVWLGLLIQELAYELTHALEKLATVIWIIFILSFLLQLVLAPHKVRFLEQNWLTVLSLIIPALRVLRIARVFRLLQVTRGFRLVKVLSSINRGMRALGSTMHRRGFGYIVLLTLLITFAGAAGMYAFEREAPDGTALNSYGESLWWTAMLMTTMGSEYWPKTPEGRALCFLIALYAFAVFGYVTATLATFFIGRDAESKDGEVAGAQALEELKAEIRLLREEVARLAKQ